MSSSKGWASRFSLVLALLMAPFFQASGASFSADPKGIDLYSRVIASVSLGNNRQAKKLLSNMRPDALDKMPSEYRKRLSFLKLWYFPTAKFSGPSVRFANQVAGKLSDILFWRFLNSGGVPDARFPGLREKLSRMFPASPLYHGPGRLSDHSASALWQESLRAFGEGDKKRAIHLWKRLVEKHPLAPESGLAVNKLGSRIMDGEILVPRWSLLVSMGMGKVAAREAKAYLAHAKSFPYRDMAILVLSQAEGREGKGREARKLISQELAQKGTHLDSLLLEERCRLFSRFHQKIDCVDQFLLRYPNSLSGRHLAIELLRQDLLTDEGLPNPLWKPPASLLFSPTGQDSLWLYGLDAYFRGNRIEAQEDWARLADYYHRSGDPSGYRAGRVYYFLGRLSALSGDGETARTWYRQVISDYPDSPFALWAGLSCGSSCPPSPVRLHYPKAIPYFWPQSVRTRILSLVQMGLWGPAWVLSSLRDDPSRIGYRMVRYSGMDLIVPPKERYQILRRVAGMKSSGLFLSGREEISPDILQGIRQSGVDRDWALSIARQESRFEGSALSIDGALGIMQLMPRTAISMARNSPDMNYRPVSRNLGRIRLPDVNSYLGGRYLGRLLAHFPKNPERAVASYNAGLHSVVRWDRLSREDWDFFVEGIPFQETRRYDREVLWNYLFIHSQGWKNHEQEP
ncbi:MAG: lytic transglycosylase domain-containing protein [Leptospirales bacterium]